MKAKDIENINSSYTLPDANFGFGVKQNTKIDIAIANLKKEINNELASLKKDKINIVEIIGAFVAFFTFISIEINIFRIPLNVISLAGFSLLNLSMITFFVSLLQTLLRIEELQNWKDIFKKINFYFILASLIFSLLSVSIIAYGQSKESKLIFIEKDNDKNRYLIIDDKTFASTTIYGAIKRVDEENKFITDTIINCIDESDYIFQVKNCLKNR